MVHRYESNEELYFSWWLKEIEEAGYITSVEYQPKSFNICDAVKKQYAAHGKRKGSYIKEITLLQPSKYTADWTWWWTEKAWDIFFAMDSYLNPKDFPFIPNVFGSPGHFKIFSVIDVKGTFDPNNNVRMFAMSQKMVYKLYNIYIQAIVPKPSVSLKKGKEGETPKLIIRPKSALFNATFTPQRYLLTDTNGKPRKIQFQVRTLKQFIDEQHNKLEALSSRMQEINQGKT